VQKGATSNVTPVLGQGPVPHPDREDVRGPVLSHAREPGIEWKARHSFRPETPHLTDNVPSADHLQPRARGFTHQAGGDLVEVLAEDRVFFEIP